MVGKKLQGGIVKEAWILGGSSGLGLELVKRAKKSKINTVVLGRYSEKEVDLADSDSVEEFCQYLESAHPKTIREATFFVWNASLLEYAPLDEMENLEEVLQIDVASPTKIIRSFVARKKELKSPFHLITIASVASWKARPNMAVYCGAKAYQALFSMALAVELKRDLSGSKVTVVNPAGMKTGLFPADVDTSEFMEPKAVVAIVWKEALAQKKFCDWFNVLRRGNKPVISRENFAPELAYDELPRYNPESSKNKKKEETHE